MNVPLRYQARRERLAYQDFVAIKPKVKDRATFRVVQDGSRYSVWFHWNSDEPVLFLDRMTHLSSAVQMISEGKRRLGADVLISVENPFTVERNRKYIKVQCDQLKGSRPSRTCSCGTEFHSKEEKAEHFKYNPTHHMWTKDDISRLDTIAEAIRDYKR